MAALPNIIPIFPLPNLVLFPGLSVPLHIFEPRYREMIADVADAHGIIGKAKRHRHFVLRDQLTGFFGEERPVRCRVDDHWFQLTAEHAAACIDLGDGHQRSVFQ